MKKEITLFTDLIPTWEIIGFDECVSDIPCRTLNDRENNPMDDNVLIRFVFSSGENVFFLPATQEIRVTDTYMGVNSLKKLFDRDIKHVYGVKGVSEKIRAFVYETVIGDKLVYRIFSRRVVCKKKYRYYECSISPPLEIRRYVFGRGGITVEYRDHTRMFTTPARISTKSIYDTLKDFSPENNYSLYNDYLRYVRLPHKKEINEALSRIKGKESGLGFDYFLEIYEKASDRREISADTPEVIKRELKQREHKPSTFLRINKELAVYTAEAYCEHLPFREQVRVYFDRERAYYFRKNEVNGRWYSDDRRSGSFQLVGLDGHYIGRDIIENTYAEKFADYALDNTIQHNSSNIWVGKLMLQVCFLCVEQAAKMKSHTYETILMNIRRDKIVDGTKSLSEIFGITGAQLKYLNDVNIPDNIEEFGELMKAEDFTANFPDVKKRIYAVSFFMDRRNARDPGAVTREEFMEASKTISSIEKLNNTRRDRIASEYRDYLRMRKIYLYYKDNISENDPLRQEILSLGEVPVNLKPSRISDLHNKLSRIVDVIDCSERFGRYTLLIEQRYKKESKDTEYTDGKYSVVMPKDAYEIVREGRVLQHCVGRAGYIESMAMNICKILFLRRNNDLETPLITMEIRGVKIVQFYGFRDSCNHDPEIRDFITEYAKEKKLKISTTVYEEKNMYFKL